MILDLEPGRQIALVSGRISSVPSDWKRPDPAAWAALLTQQKPEPEAFGVLVELVTATDRRLHGQILVALYGVKVHHWIFQLALAIVWRCGGGGRVVVDAAGSRETLKSWFAHARFDWPADELVAECMTVWSPREMTVFRGGRGDPAKLAAEYSWTPIRAIAARYALNWA